MKNYETYEYYLVQPIVLCKPWLWRHFWHFPYLEKKLLEQFQSFFEENTSKCTLKGLYSSGKMDGMAIQFVEFSREEYKIKKVLG